MRLLALLLIFVTVTSCRQKEVLSENKLTSNERATVSSEVEDLLNRNFQLIKHKGYTAELQSLYNSPDFYWIPPRRSMPISYDSVARILFKFTPGYKSVECVWDELHIQPLTSEIASYTGRFHATYIDSTDAVTRFRMMELGVARKISGEWKLVSGQTSISPDQKP